MTAQVFYHPQARHYLKDIFRHLADSNPSAAAAILRLIGQKACRLAETPGVGQAVEDLAPRLRRFPVGNYPIFYRVSDPGASRGKARARVENDISVTVDALSLSA